MPDGPMLTGVNDRFVQKDHVGYLGVTATPVMALPVRLGQRTNRWTALVTDHRCSYRYITSAELILRLVRPCVFRKVSRMVDAASSRKAG